MACIFYNMPCVFFSIAYLDFFCAQCATEMSVFAARLVHANSKNVRDLR